MTSISTDSLLMFQMLANGLEFKEIAANLGIGIDCLKHRLCKLYQETGTDNDRHFVAYLFRKGLVK